MDESASEAAAVIAGSKQVASTRPEDWSWVDRSIWTERMLAALGNGVRGGKWFSLIDKVYRPATLRSAWQQVLVNRGAAGVDRLSVERFAGHLDRYLGELGRSWKRVVIGRCRCVGGRSRRRTASCVRWVSRRFGTAWRKRR